MGKTSSDPSDLVTTLLDPIHEILSRLQGVKRRGQQWQARCPAHDDQVPSLSIGRGQGGAVLLKCHAGCATKDILREMGLSMSNLYPSTDQPVKRNSRASAPKRQQRGPVWPTIEQAASAAANRECGKAGGIWHYPERGDQQMAIVRIDLPNNKTCRPFHRVAEGWRPGDPPGPLPLYRIDEVAEAKTIYVVEGEKCAEAAWSIGLPATTSSHGAQAPQKSDWSPLAGKQVIIIPDADPAGEAYATAVIGILDQLDPPAVPKVVRLPGPGDGKPPAGWDIHDWLEDRDSVEPEQLRRQIEKIAAAAKDAGSPHRPQIRTLRQLLVDHPQLHEPVIEGLLRQGETMNVIAPPKRGKSWLVGDLAISAAIGTTWLGQYPTVQGDVLILDNELHGPTLASRLPRIALARGLAVEAIADHIHVDCLRGRLLDLLQLGPYFRSIEPGRFRLVILDALYRFWPPDSDENDNGTVAAMFNCIDAYAAHLGCAFVLIHHSTKGSQAGKSVTDVGAGAGAQSRAADTHLVLRDHDEPGAIVPEAAARSWPPINPACFRWEFPIWTPAPELDPAALRGTVKRGKGKGKEEPQWNPRTFADAFINGEPQTKERVVANAVDKGISGRAAGQMLRMAEELGVVYRWTFGPKKPVKFANREQTVTESTEAAK